MQRDRDQADTIHGRAPTANELQTKERNRETWTRVYRPIIQHLRPELKPGVYSPRVSLRPASQGVGEFKAGNTHTGTLTR